MVPLRKSVIATLTLGVLITLGAIRGADLYWRREEVVRTAARRAGNLSSILAEYVHGTFSAGDASLRQLSLHSQRVGGPAAPDADWAPSLASSRAGLKGAGSISVTDAKGVIRHSTQPAIVGQSRREQYIFRRLSNELTDSFVVDTPYLSALEPKQYLIPVGRRLTTKDGAFDGIVAITFTPAALRDFFGTIDVGAGGTVWVLHPDGFVLFREPSRANPIGESSASNPIFEAAMQQPPSGVLAGRVGADGPVMLSAYRVTDTPPLIVAVSLDRAELLADWQRQVVGSVIFFLVLGATMTATLAVLFRQMDARAAVQRELFHAREDESRHLKQVNERLEKALEIEQAAHRETELAARLKDEFVMTVSHELRTPLTSITGWVQILETGRLDAPQTKAAIDTIARSARAQARLIDDLLDVSRIISGKLRLDVRSMRVADVVRDAVATVRPAADAKALRLDTVIDPESGTIAADPDRLQQIVWNLLSNAIKFTPAGGRVVVSAQRSDATIDIVVRDSGVGITAEFLPHVFDRFRQGDAGSQRSHGGLGLGLAIVRHLVELHGGTVRAESAGPGHGATFRVTLPIRTPADSDRGSPETVRTQAAPGLD
jgi:signal transduction histidine kinase